MSLVEFIEPEPVPEVGQVAVVVGAELVVGVEVVVLAVAAAHLAVVERVEVGNLFKISIF